MPIHKFVIQGAARKTLSGFVCLVAVVVTTTIKTNLASSYVMCV